MKVEVILYSGEVYEIKGIYKVNNFLDSIYGDESRFVKVGYKTYEYAPLPQGENTGVVVKGAATWSIEKHVDVASIKEFNIHEQLGGYAKS